MADSRMTHHGLRAAWSYGCVFFVLLITGAAWLHSWLLIGLCSLGWGYALARVTNHAYQEGRTSRRPW